jgi:hypothetical protein
VKHLRTFILVLLAVLLPIRGAVAATMLCPQGQGAGMASMGAAQWHGNLHAGHGMHAAHPASHHHAGADVANDVPNDPPNGASSGGHPANCHFCAGGGCLAYIAATLPPLGQPGPSPSVVFPALRASVPDFPSDGQDRPPRTI